VHKRLFASCKEIIMPRMYTSLLLVMMLFFTAIVPHSYGTTITWNPNTEKDIGGYQLYYGTSSGQYTAVLDLGNVTSCEFSKLIIYEHDPYFVAVTAYDISGNESSFSQELPLSSDDLIDYEDNCPDIYNPDQKDSYPPAGNGIGDACECEGDFACDGDVDGYDAALFKEDSGRNRFHYPCTDYDPCNGDFECDGDVDGWDAMLFKADSGRNVYNKPCPTCIPGDLCVY